MASMVKINKAKQSLKEIFTTFLGNEISGLDKFIYTNEQSAEAMEKAEIAQILKQSQEDLNARN